MGERLRGVTVALLIVAVAALTVAYASSFKAKASRRQVVAMKSEMDRLKQAKQELEKQLDETEQKYKQEASNTESLNEALAQEQLKNKALAARLEPQQQKKVAQDAHPSESKNTPTTNF